MSTKAHHKKWEFLFKKFWRQLNLSEIDPHPEGPTQAFTALYNTQGLGPYKQPRAPAYTFGKRQIEVFFYFGIYKKNNILLF